MKTDILTADGLYLGEDRAIRHLVTDQVLTDDWPAGSPINCTTFAMMWVMVRAIGGSPIINKATGGSGITVADVRGTGDAVDVQLDRADSVDLQPGKYYYTLRRIDTGTNIHLADGEIVFRQGAGI